MIDAYSVSHFDKNPNRRNDLEYEVAETVKLREEMDSLGARDKYVCLGNHETRLIKYISQKAPALYNSIKIEKILGFEENGWKVTAYQDYFRIGKMFFTHDLGQAGETAHIKARNDFSGCVVIGHVHRLGLQYAGNSRGESHVGICAGWLGDLKSVDYMHRAKSKAWQHGVLIGYLQDDGVVRIQPIPFINNSAIVEGKLIRG